MAQNLTHAYNKLFIQGLSSQNAIEAYTYRMDANSLGMILDVDLVINQGNDLSMFDPDSEITVILHGFYRKFIVTDVTTTIPGDNSYNFHITMVEPVYLKAEYVPARPIAYLSKNNKEMNDFLREDVLYSLDFDARLKTHEPEDGRFGWKLSEISKEIGKAIEIDIYFSGQVNPYIGEFTVQGSFFEALNSLTNKYGMKPIYIPSFTGGDGKIVIVDALSGRGYTSGYAYFLWANSITEEKTSLPFPSFVRVIGGQEYVNPLTYDGAATPFRTLHRRNLNFGNIRTYAPNQDKDSEGNNIFATYDAELSDTSLSLKNWANGYSYSYSEESGYGPTYTETESYQTDFEYYNPEYFGLDRESFTQEQDEKKDLQLPSRVKTYTAEKYTNDFFGTTGPLIHRCQLSYVDNINGYSFVNLDNGLPSPRFVIGYVEEAFNFGTSVSVKYEAPRYYSPIITAEQQEDGSYRFYRKTSADASTIVDTNSFALQNYGASGSTNIDINPLLAINDGSHIPYHIKLEYGRLPIPSTIDSEDTNAGKQSQTKLVPIRLEMDFISYAEWYENAYTEGSVKGDAKVVFEPVAVDQDGRKISVSKNQTIEEGEKFTLIPTAWNSYESEQDWTSLHHPECMTYMEVNYYTPTGDGKSYMKNSNIFELEDGSLRNSSTSEVVIGSIPHAELKKRKEDIVETQVIDSSAKELWMFDLYKYHRAPLEIHDPALISRHDAKTLARRWKYYYKRPVIKRTFTYDGILNVPVGHGIIFHSIYGAPVPFNDTSIGRAGASRLIEGETSSYRRGMITGVEISHSGTSAQTVITAETLNL